MKKKSRQRQAGSEEKEFLGSYDATQFSHPSVTVDVALMTAESGALKALLVKRQEHPDRGKWSLPGGFVRIPESLEESAVRVLSTKTGLQGIFLEQLYTFGAPERDPRTRVITVAYYALVDSGKLWRIVQLEEHIQLATLRVPWTGETGGPVDAVDAAGKRLAVAFDHARILGTAVGRLRGKLNYAPIGFELLPRLFTLLELQTIHETILGRPLNKDSFRRRMLASGLIAPTGQRETDVGHRPAELYRFKRNPAR